MGRTLFVDLAWNQPDGLQTIRIIEAEADIDLYVYSSHDEYGSYQRSMSKRHL